MAKKYIRHALNDLQEALSLLDIAHAEFIQPTKIKEDYSKLIEESNKLFDEFKEMKELPGGTTIIRNIENVNIKLSSAPQIEAIFEEVQHITKSAQEYIEKSAKGIISGEEEQKLDKRLPVNEIQKEESGKEAFGEQGKEASVSPKGVESAGNLGKESSAGAKGKESSYKESGKVSPDERVSTDDDEKKRKK